MKKSSKESIMIAKYINLFLTEYAPNHKTNSDKTLKAYEITLSLYLEFLENEKKITIQTLSANCFNRIMIEEWKVWLLKSRNNKPQTCNNRLSSLRTFLEYLSSREITLSFLYAESTTVSFEKTVKTKVKGISKKAIEVLMTIPNLATKTGRRDLVLIVLMYNTAVRISEVLELKIKNVYLDVKEPYVLVLGKGNKLRSLFLLPKTVAYLKKYIKEFHGDNPNPNSHVFYSRNRGLNEQISDETIRQRLIKYATKAHDICPEVPSNLTPHQIRHAKASHWLEDGMNIMQISLLLGHAQLETTMCYLDVTIGQMASGLATLESESEQKISKKWKNVDSDLKEYCGIKNNK